jgi:hypothetical protein
MSLVIATGQEYRQLGSTDILELILASCAIADGANFARKENALYRID